MKRTFVACLGILLAGAVSARTASAMIAAEQYGWYEGFYGEEDTTTSGGGGDPTCGTGTKTLCEARKVTTCTQWQNTSGGIGISGTGGNLSLGTTCAVWVETITYKYYP
jgi:hypothetical protein